MLVIDDSQDVHRLLRARLKHEDLELLAAGDGKTGLTLAAEQMPSAILLDLDMPGMDGFEVLRALKEEAKTHNIPVIVLSGLQSPQDKVMAFDLGAVDYVTKPFDLTELRVRVRSAVRMQQLLKMLAQKAQIDGLTGLWNRVYFNHRWSEEVSRASRRGGNLSIAMLDVDHFKSINDTYGHPAGDQVIQGLAKLLQRECRQSDLACRYGGEEFALIMPDTATTDAKAVCERIRAAFEALTWARHPERTVTISIGVCGGSGAGAVTAESWVDQADRNLYQAKHSGRNRVIASDASDLSTLRAAV